MVEQAETKISKLEEKLRKEGFNEVCEIISEAFDGKEVIVIENLQQLLNIHVLNYSNSRTIKIVKARDLGRKGPNNYIIYQKQYSDSSGC